VELYFWRCISDYYIAVKSLSLANLNSELNAMLCDLLTEYSQLCAEATGSGFTWRNDSFCRKFISLFRWDSTLAVLLLSYSPIYFGSQYSSSIGDYSYMVFYFNVSIVKIVCRLHVLKHVMLLLGY